jgi:hypothetical protein
LKTLTLKIYRDGKRNRETERRKYSIRRKEERERRDSALTDCFCVKVSFSASLAPGLISIPDSYMFISK